MGNKATDEQIAIVRSVVGRDFSDMDIIRALHMANNNAAAAINIILDTPHLRLTGESTAAATITSPANAQKKCLSPNVASDRKELVKSASADLPAEQNMENGAGRPCGPAAPRSSVPSIARTSSPVSKRKKRTNRFAKMGKGGIMVINIQPTMIIIIATGTNNDHYHLCHGHQLAFKSRAGRNGWMLIFFAILLLMIIKIAVKEACCPRTNLLCGKKQPACCN